MLLSYFRKPRFQLQVFVAFAFLLPDVQCTQDINQHSWSSTAYEWGLLGRYPQQQFRSSPLRPPLLNTVQWDEECAHGYTLLSVRGTMVPNPAGIMLDEYGDLIWMDESFGPYVMNLKIQEYRGEQYLTFWSGEMAPGFGLGTYFMLDSHYQVFKQFSATNTRENDFHEYLITADDTALLTSYDIVSTDLSSLGIESPGWIYDSVFREIDIETGKLKFEWRASDHFAVNDTFYPIGSTGRSPETPFDFFHINSVDKDDDGNFVVSSRFMHSIACVSSSTGNVLWVLGGRNNDFEDISNRSATDFAWQHHVSVQPNDKLSIFDNARYKKWHQELLGGDGEISRGMLVQLDTNNMTVELVREYMNPDSRGTPQQGSMQVLDSGNVLLGWGYYGGFTEYAADGTVLCDTHINPAMLFPFGFVHSYRAFRASSWIGRPTTRPDVYLEPSDGHAFVSWMGATEVVTWVLQTASASPDSELVFTNSVETTKIGFETKVDMPEGDYDYLRIVAVDKAGDVLGTSKIMSANGDARGSAWTTKSWVSACIFWTICLVLSLLLRKRLSLSLRRDHGRICIASWLRRYRGPRWPSASKHEEEERLYDGGRSQ